MQNRKRDKSSSQASEPKLDLNTFILMEQGRMADPFCAIWKKNASSLRSHFFKPRSIRESVSLTESPICKKP